LAKLNLSPKDSLGQYVLWFQCRSKSDKYFWQSLIHPTPMQCGSDQ
jgi:hypothetical protein